MTLFAPPRFFDPNNPEFIDRPDTDPALLREEVRLLEILNRYSWGQQLMIEYVQECIESFNLKSMTILDLGTGAADIPRAIARWAAKHSFPLTIVAVDVNPVVLQVAREACRQCPQIRLERQDLRTLPYAAESFDLVLCSMALHHFAMPDAVTILRRIQEVARLRYVVNDLRRNWFAIWLMELLTRTIIRRGIVRHDGPRSYWSAFTIAELRNMARQAELRNFCVRNRHGCFRMALEGTK